MAIYKVMYTHVVERRITELISADNEKEALENSKNYVNVIESDEYSVGENTIDIKDYKVFKYKTENLK